MLNVNVTGIIGTDSVHPKKRVIRMKFKLNYTYAYSYIFIPFV